MRLTVVILLLCALPFGSMADKPKVNLALIKAMEDSVDNHLMRLWPDDPVEMIGVTRGAYVSGSGVVFVAGLNLAPSTGISPFHKNITPDEMKRIHEKKLARLPKLKAAMQEWLLNSSGSLDPVPPEEQIALGITLFYWVGRENTEGLPAQIVMHGSKRALLDIRTGRADKSTLSSALTVEEF
jgi:hypothetical protein